MNDSTSLDSTVPELLLAARGKVRDIDDLDDALLIVATDRISAFDVVLPTPIPDKGRVLTHLSRFWFKRTESIVRNHFLTMDLGLALFTPATKAPQGQHDENISFERMTAMVGRERAEAVRCLSLRLYEEAAHYAAQRGLIVADTKFAHSTEGRLGERQPVAAAHPRAITPGPDAVSRQ